MQSFEVLSALGYLQHLVKCWPLFHQLYFVYLQLYFHLGVVPDTEFDDHNRKLSLQKLLRTTKKG